jgi:uncharacterized UPF0146 family protein
MNIEYKQAKKQDHITEFKNYLDELIICSEIKKICEVGGGANPAISLDHIQKYDLEYTLLDISPQELAKAPEKYHKIQADISSTNLNLDEQFDLIFSIMLAEHVPSGEAFHKNVFNLLRNGGYALHVFPTMYALPFLTNQILPEILSQRLLWMLSPHRKNELNKLKFPAYYSWCRGPIKSQISKFENLGYRVEEYIGFFGTPAYFRKIKPLSLLDELVSSLFTKYPQPLVTSYAYVLLRKQA